MILQEGDNALNVQLVPEAAPPPATFNIYGVVTNAQTGSPIEGVKVTIGSNVTYTNSDGEYAWENLRPPGNYTITFEKDGFETVVR